MSPVDPGEGHEAVCVERPGVLLLDALKGVVRHFLPGTDILGCGLEEAFHELSCLVAVVGVDVEPRLAMHDDLRIIHEYSQHVSLRHHMPAGALKAFLEQPARFMTWSPHEAGSQVLQLW